jgi:hypothetical protein
LAPLTIVTEALFLVWLAAPVTTVAQFTGTQFGVAGGPTLPVGSFQSNSLAGGYGFRVGWQGMAFVSYRGPDGRVGGQFDAGYAVNTSHDSINGQPTDAKVQFLGADADLTVMLSTKTRVKVYLLGGFGIHNVTLSFSGRALGPTHTNAAWNTGWGVTVGALFFEARYMHIEGIGLGFPAFPFLAVTAGLRLGGWSP